MFNTFISFSMSNDYDDDFSSTESEFVVDKDSKYEQILGPFKMENNNMEGMPTLFLSNNKYNEEYCFDSPFVKESVILNKQEYKNIIKYVKIMKRLLDTISNNTFIKYVDNPEMQNFLYSLYYYFLIKYNILIMQYLHDIKDHKNYKDDLVLLAFNETVKQYNFINSKMSITFNPVLEGTIITETLQEYQKIKNIIDYAKNIIPKIRNDQHLFLIAPYILIGEKDNRIKAVSLFNTSLQQKEIDLTIGDETFVRLIENYNKYYNVAYLMDIESIVKEMLKECVASKKVFVEKMHMLILLFIIDIIERIDIINNFNFDLNKIEDKQKCRSYFKNFIEKNKTFLIEDSKLEKYLSNVDDSKTKINEKIIIYLCCPIEKIIPNYQCNNNFYSELREKKQIHWISFDKNIKKIDNTYTLQNLIKVLFCEYPKKNDIKIIEDEIIDNFTEIKNKDHKEDHKDFTIYNYNYRTRLMTSKIIYAFFVQDLKFASEQQQIEYFKGLSMGEKIQIIYNNVLLDKTEKNKILFFNNYVKNLKDFLPNEEERKGTYNELVNNLKYLSNNNEICDSLLEELLKDLETDQNLKNICNKFLDDYQKLKENQWSICYKMFQSLQSLQEHKKTINKLIKNLLLNQKKNKHNYENIQNICNKLEDLLMDENKYKYTYMINNYNKFLTDLFVDKKYMDMENKKKKIYDDFLKVLPANEREKILWYLYAHLSQFLKVIKKPMDRDTKMWIIYNELINNLSVNKKEEQKNDASFLDIYIHLITSLENKSSLIINSNQKFFIIYYRFLKNLIKFNYYTFHDIYNDFNQNFDYEKSSKVSILFSNKESQKDYSTTKKMNKESQKKDEYEYVSYSPKVHLWKMEYVVEFVKTIESDWRNIIKKQQNPIPLKNYIIDFKEMLNNFTNDTEKQLDIYKESIINDLKNDRMPFLMLPKIGKLAKQEENFIRQEFLHFQRYITNNSVEHWS